MRRYARVTRFDRTLGVVGIRLVIALIGFCSVFLNLLPGLDHAEHLDGQSVVHQVRDKILRDRLDVLTDVRKVRIPLLLPHLRFKYGFIRVDPLVLSHRLECVLFGDVRRAFDAELDLEVLADEFPQSFVLQNVQLRSLVVVQDRELYRVVLHAVLDSFRVDDGRVVLRSVDQIEEREEEDVDAANFMPTVRKTPAEGFSFAVGVLARLNVVGESVTRDYSRVLLVSPVLVNLDDDLGDFCSVTFDLCSDFRLVVDLLLADFAADCVRLGDDRNDLLKFDIDFSQLLQSLLVVQLVSHLLFELLLGLSLFILEDLLLLFHFEFKLCPLLLQSLKSLLAVSTS